MNSRKITRNSEVLRRVLIFVGGAVSFSTMTAAAGNTPQPGQWEYQVEIKMPSMPMGPQKTTFKRCLKPEDVVGNKHLQQDNHGDCKLNNLKVDGTNVSYDFVCKGQDGTVTGTAKGAVDSTQMDFETRMKMTPPMPGMGEMQQKMKAKRLGGC